MAAAQEVILPKERGKRRFKMPLEHYVIGYSFLAPFIILFSVFIIVPVGISIFLSLTSYNMIQPAVWVGLNNYQQLILEDDVFLIALQNTIIFSVVTGPLGFLLSFCAAWAINLLKARNAFALAFYVPSLTSGIALSVVWMNFFSPDRYGLINNALINMGVITEPILWNLSSQTVLPVIMIIQLWMSMGNGFLVFLAGLQNVNQELYEAGQVDGIYSKFQELWYITLPQMKPQLLFGAIQAIVSTLSVYDITVGVVGNVISPNYAAHTIVTHMYDYAFLRFQMGYASAVSVILFLLTFGLGQVFMRMFKSK